MILPCALNKSVEFIRSCKKAWLVFILLVFATVIHNSIRSIILWLNLGKRTSDIFHRILSQLDPFLLVFLYLFTVLAVLVLEFAGNKDESLKLAAKVSLKRFPHLLSISIVVTLLIFFLWMLIGFLASLPFSLYSTEFSFAIAILALVPTSYVLIRLSLYFCYVIEGEFLRSLKLSWRVTRKVWPDILIIGLCLSVVDQLISFPNPFDLVFSTLAFAFLVIVLTFVYIEYIKKNSGGECG